MFYVANIIAGPVGFSNTEAQRHKDTEGFKLPAAGVSVLESGSSNWESTTLAPAYAARPKASVDIPSWRLALGHANKIATPVGPVSTWFWCHKL